MPKIKIVRAKGENGEEIPAEWIGIEARLVPEEELLKTDAFFLTDAAREAYRVIVGEDVYRSLSELARRCADQKGRLPRLWIPKDYCEEVPEQNDGPP